MGKFTYGNKSAQEHRRQAYSGSSNRLGGRGVYASNPRNRSEDSRESRESNSSGRSSGGFRGSRSGFGRSNGRSGGFRGGRSGFGRVGARRKISSYSFHESMFVKKAEPSIETIEYKPSFLFPELKVNQILKANIASKKFDIPTPIQDKSIPVIMKGMDMLGIANTGTGKTAAFLIPLIEKIINNPKEKVLIITPTRELADQINEELFQLTKGLRIFSVQCIGGSNINNQIYNLKRGFNFVVGTPGRLKDLMERRFLNLGLFGTVVLDEVDRMLDMGFVDDIKYLISFLNDDRQSLFFSATIDKRVEEIIDVILKEDHEKISVKTGETAENVHQDIVRINRHDEKIPKLEELLKNEEFEKVLIFVNTKREVDHLDQYLYDKGYAVESIHGERKQSQRKRSISNFKEGRAKILIATDVAARGLDIKNVSHVINYDIPNNYEDYIHRIGRTGRANKIGNALTFVESRGSR